MEKIYSVELCQKMVDAAEKSLLKAMEAQSYSIGGRSLSRASVESCQKTYDLWMSRLAAAKGVRKGKSKIFTAVPV